MYGWVPPLQEILVLECVKFPPWGCISAPAGVAPKALEECVHSSKGYESSRLCGRSGDTIIHHSFQPVLALLSADKAAPTLFGPIQEDH